MIIYPIFTNHALIKMRNYGLSEEQVLDTFNNGLSKKEVWVMILLKNILRTRWGLLYC